ncbi:hypothetical protein DL768_005719 [Monosporascus sp. mg162]|nr:hypothetical protein DL768_005719 [Monosporascus sp. mg162]
MWLIEVSQELPEAQLDGLDHRSRAYFLFVASTGSLPAFKGQSAKTPKAKSHDTAILAASAVMAATTPRLDASQTNPQFTKDTEPSSPTLQQHAKRQRHVDVEPPPKINLQGKEPALPKDSIVNLVTSKYDEIEREERILKEVMVHFARQVDNFVQSYNGPHQQTQREFAYDLGSRIVNYLKTQVFAETDGKVYAPVRVRSRPTITNTERQELANEPAKAQVSWAAVARAGPTNPNSPSGGGAPTRSAMKTPGVGTTTSPGAVDAPRILAQIPTQLRLSRAEPFVLRNLICKALGLKLADIPAITPTKTGWALRPATKILQDRIMEPEAKSKVKDILKADNLELPVKWYNYAVPNTPHTIHTIHSVMQSELVKIKDFVYEEAESQPGLIKGDSEEDSDQLT